MATQKKGTSWQDVMNQVQKTANNTGQTAVVTVTAPPKKGPPKQPAYIPTQNTYGTSPRRGPSSNNVVTYQERPQAGFLAPGQQGPRTRPQAQGGPTAASRQGYSFTQAQPKLAAAAANKLRSQYASIQGPAGGSFVTDTNQGLLDLLQAAGITPTPLNQWGQLANRLRR